MSPINVNSWPGRVLLFGAAFASPTLAEDTVVLDVGQDGRTTRVVGEVLEYTGEWLTIRRSSGRKELLDSRQVREVQTTWNKDFESAESQFKGGHWETAFDSYRRSFAAEQREWARRRVVARMVWCCQYLGQVSRAVTAFEWLYRSDPTTQHFAAIPLAWLADPRAGSYQEEAVKWLASDAPSTRLIGASWLISTAQRSEAIRVLEELDAPDMRIVHLAQAQLWRTRVGTATPAQISSWRRQLDKMPTAIRAGPYYTLARAWSQRKLSEDAALAFLRVPIHFQQHRGLAAYALVAAGRELEKLDQPESAIVLYREVVADHSESPIANEAQRQLSRLGLNE